MEPQRDLVLGRALRALPAPAHTPGFGDRLHALLLDEAATRPAARRRVPGPPGRRVGPPAGRTGPPSGRGRPTPRAVLRLGAGVALALAVFVVLAVLPGDRAGRVGPQPATAAEIVSRARTALASVRSLQAVLLSRTRFASGEPLRTSRLRVTLNARGDLRVLGDRENGDTYFSARRGREVQLRLPYAPGAFVMDGLAPGAPDGLGGGSREVALQTAAVTRALAAAGDAAVSEGTLDGRRVFTLRTAVPVNKLGFSGDRLLVAIDRASGFPVRVRETFRGRVVSDLSLRDLRLSPRVGSGVFSPTVPAGTPRVNGGFRRTTFAAAAGRVGYAPLTPALPRGFRRAETSTAAATSSPTGDEGLNPPSVDVVSTAYRRGLDRVVVSTRRTGPRPRAWADPVAAGEGNRVRTERIRIRGGALRGAVARLVIDPRVEPHVWVVTDRLVVTITGALTRAELVTAVESLRAG